MKKLLAVLILGGGMALSSSGCATPAYSAHERSQMIARNQAYEWRQAQDDIDSLLLLRPSGNMTIWHVK